MLEKTEGTVKNRQSRDMGNIGPQDIERRPTKQNKKHITEH